MFCLGADPGVCDAFISFKHAFSIMPAEPTVLFWSILVVLDCLCHRTSPQKKPTETDAKWNTQTAVKRVFARAPLISWKNPSVCRVLAPGKLQSWYRPQLRRPLQKNFDLKMFQSATLIPVLSLLLLLSKNLLRMDFHSSGTVSVKNLSGSHSYHVSEPAADFEAIHAPGSNIPCCSVPSAVIDRFTE